MINRLEELAWWDWEEIHLKKNLELFSEDFNEEVLIKLEKYKKEIIDITREKM